MKRSIDDVYPSSQLRLPVNFSRVGLSEQVQMSSESSAQRLTTNDALTYLKAVKDIFRDKRDKYNEFLEVMKDFKAQRIDTSGVIERVKELFKGHRDLILGFNTFLPKGYEITLPPDEPPLAKKPVLFEEAMSFVNKIKIRFQGDDRVYKGFLHILNMYRKESKSITEVYQDVSSLFLNHADLLVEFTHFLPDTSGAASVQLPRPGRNQFLGWDDSESPMSMTRSMHDGKKLIAPDGGCELGVDRSDQEEWRAVSKDQGKREDRDRREQDSDHNFTHKRKLPCRDSSVTDQFQKGMQDSVSAFCEKVKERLQDPDDYTKFMDCVRSYENTWVTRTQLQLLVNNLLGTHADLMEEFNEFIILREKNGCLRNSKHIIKSVKAEDRKREREREREGNHRNKDHDNRERDRFDRGVPFSNKDIAGQRMSLYASRDRYIGKPIQELDLSNCECCTPSYRRLPEIYQIPSASQRTKIGNEVLNDVWVSVTSGSEDYSFKHMRKNQYEESLFKCEDDRFELDMLLESMKVTAKRVEELLDKMNDNISVTRIEDHLTALNQRCIERIYGDHGLDVLDVLKKNASVALPVILLRLKQKQDEWERCRADFNKVWAEIYAKNYHKSLDHRSFYFKQQDTKSWSTKALLAEIKEIREKNQKEDEVLLFSLGHLQPNRPNLQFEYRDPAIHEDLYRLINYSCKEVCSNDQIEKVMRIWTTFLEQVLDVPSRSEGAENIEYVAKADNQVTETVSCIGEWHKSPVHGGDQMVPNVKEPGSTEMLVANDDNGGKDGCALSVDYVTCTGELLPNRPQDGMMRIDANVVAETSGASIRQPNPDAAGAGGIHGFDGLFATSARVDNINAEHGIEMRADRGLQDAVRTQLPSSSDGSMLGEFKAQKCHEESVLPFNCEPEAGEFCPSGDLKPCEDGGGDADDDNDDDEGDESAEGSSDSENASENGDVLESDSANAENCSPQSDDKVESEGEAEGATGAQETDAEGMTMPVSECFIQNCQPIAVYVPPELREKQTSSRFFYGNDDFYVLFRLHQKLYERIRKAKLHASSAENKWRVSDDMFTTDSYSRLMIALYNLLNGSFDNAKFEDECRAIVGTQSYLLFTLDKLIYKLVKQLQTISTDEIDNKLLQLYAYERSRTPEKSVDEVYHSNARLVLKNDNVYRIASEPSPLRLSIQFMYSRPEISEKEPLPADPKFADYMRNEFFTAVPERNGNPPVFLKRNKRKYECEDQATALSQANDGLVVYNGLEIRINSSTFKMAYVLDSEDFMFRKRKRNEHSSQNGSSNGASNGSSGKPKRILLS